MTKPGRNIVPARDATISPEVYAERARALRQEVADIALRLIAINKAMDDLSEAAGTYGGNGYEACMRAGGGLEHDQASLWNAGWHLPHVCHHTPSKPWMEPQP